MILRLFVFRFKYCLLTCSITHVVVLCARWIFLVLLLPKKNIFCPTSARRFCLAPVPSVVAAKRKFLSLAAAYNQKTLRISNNEPVNIMQPDSFLIPFPHHFLSSLHYLVNKCVYMYNKALITAKHQVVITTWQCKILRFRNSFLFLILDVKMSTQMCTLNMLPKQ